LRGSTRNALTIKLTCTLGGFAGVWAATCEVQGQPPFQLDSSIGDWPLPGIAEGLSISVSGVAAAAGQTVTFTINSQLELALGSGALSGNKHYLTHRVGSQLGTTPSPVYSAYRIEIAVFDFVDAYRWQSMPFSDLTCFAGGVQSSFDGRRVFETGILTRPRIIEAVNDPNAATPQLVSNPLVAGKTYYFRAVYTWLDSGGNRWFSAPSFASRTGDGYSLTAVPSTIVGPVTVRPFNLRLTLPQCFSGMVSGADFFKNSMEVWVYVASEDLPGVYLLATQLKADQGAVSKYDIFSGNPSAIVTIDRMPLSSADQLYTVGGELANSPPPTCRVIEAHRDRLFAIDSSTNRVYYPKPLTAGRGVEWCTLTQYFEIPEEGLGLA
jgi:hypothetical protein